jgi:hypothetical protein
MLAGHYCHGGAHRRNGVPIDMDGSRDACAAVIAGRRVGEHLTGHHGRPERVIAFAIREQTGIGRDDGSAKLKHQSAADTRRPCCSSARTAFGMRVYGPRDIAYVRGVRDGAARLLARRSLLFHRELFEVPFRHADREACTLPQLAIF